MATYIILGASILLIGIVFRIFPPKANLLVGYRTKMSMLNQETWEVGNRYAFNLFILFGTLSVIAGISSYYSSYDPKIVAGSTIVSLFLIIILTEMKLRKLFDKEGNRK